MVPLTCQTSKYISYFSFESWSDKEGTYQDIVSAPDVWNQIMVELGLSLNVLSFKPA